MYTTLITQLNTMKNNNIILPKDNDLPISASEKLVREEIKKLTENAEEIRKLKERIDEKDKNEKQE